MPFIFAILIIILLKECVTIIPENYDRTIYSVVIHNSSEFEIDDILVSYGHSLEDESTLFEFCRIDELHSDEYRKINIDTTTPSEQAQVPYNVFVSVNYGEHKTFSTAGYFGEGSGGLSYLELKIDDGKPTLQRVYEHEREYKRILKRHYKNQTESSWGTKGDGLR